MEGERGTIKAFPVDERAFLVNADDPDTLTVTFSDFDRSGRPGALYQMLWGCRACRRLGRSRSADDALSSLRRRRRHDEPDE